MLHSLGNRLVLSLQRAIDFHEWPLGWFLSIFLEATLSIDLSSAVALRWCFNAWYDRNVVGQSLCFVKIKILVVLLTSRR